VLIGDRQPPGVPSASNLPKQRHDRLLEERRRADHGGAPPEQLVEPASIEVLNPLEGGLDERRVGTRSRWRRRGMPVLRDAIFGNELCEVGRREARNPPDPAPRPDGRVQQSETLDVGVGVQTLATRGAGRGDGAISTFPNPEYVL